MVGREGVDGQDQDDSVSRFLPNPHKVVFFIIGFYLFKFLYHLHNSKSVGRGQHCLLSYFLVVVVSADADRSVHGWGPTPGNILQYT